MSRPIISVENLSKSYRLGQIGTGTLTNDLKVWFAKVQGKPNPMLKIGQADHGNMDGETLWALKDVNFQVEQGEVLGIIGRNGAGKSTLLKILSRVTAPTSGRIKVRGRIASLLEVGTGFHPDLTGKENIFLNGAILGMTKAEVKRKLDEIVAFAEIEKFIDTPVKRYSSGMYVRLAFAVAAHLESEILLVDEVLAVGDAEFQKRCLGKMGEVASKEGRTVIFVSHNMGSITGLTHKCIYIRSGSIAKQGTTKDIVDYYLSEVSRENQLHEGFADLREFPRKLKIQNPVAQFTWVKILDDNNIEKSILTKGQIFSIETGFNLSQPTTKLQFGFGVKHVRSGVEIFISPSPIFYDNFLNGNHTIKMLVDPNFLHPGLYNVVLKMFCKGVRQETIGEVLFFEIIEDSGKSKEETFTDRWSSGLLDFNFGWNLSQMNVHNLGPHLDNSHLFTNE